MRNMAGILNKTVHFHPNLKTLLIRNFYFRIPIDGELLDRGSERLRLQGSRIEELNISDNRAFFGGSGISRYLPHLKSLRNSNNLLVSCKFGPRSAKLHIFCRAIIVLSPNFLQSNWCNFEFKMARQIDIEEDRDMIILVSFEVHNRM